MWPKRSSERIRGKGVRRSPRLKQKFEQHVRQRMKLMDRRQRSTAGGHPPPPIQHPVQDSPPVVVIPAPSNFIFIKVTVL